MIRKLEKNELKIKENERGEGERVRVRERRLRGKFLKLKHTFTVSCFESFPISLGFSFRNAKNTGKKT